MALRVDPRQEQELKDLATRMGRTVEEVLHDLLEAQLHPGRDEQEGPAANGKEESFLQAAYRLGAVGCVKGGPTDLATNPGHLKGLGED